MRDELEIELVFSGAPRGTRSVTLVIRSGLTVAQVVRQSQILRGLSDGDIDELTLGIRGRKVHANHVLLAGDRVDICRPLKVDPKLARRERFVRQGAKAAGLFSKLRQGAKAGY